MNRRILLIAALWLALPSAAQPAAETPLCPQAPYTPLLDYARNMGVTSAPIPVEQINDQIATMIAAPPPQSSPSDDTGLYEAVIRALNIGFLLRSLDSEALEVNISSRTDQAGYTQETLNFQDRATGGFRALLLIPKGNSQWYPAIVGLHGHNDTPEVFAQRYMGAELAKKGFIVLMPDFSLSAECDNRLSMALLREGLTLLGVRVYHALLAIKYLRSLGYARADRIGIIGHSNGSSIANLVVRLRNPPAAQVSDFESDYLDTSMATTGGIIHCETIPALFPYFAAVNDGTTSKTPLLRVPYGFSRLAYKSEILSFFDRALRPAPNSEVPENAGDPYRLDDYFKRVTVDLGTGRRPEAREELQAALEIWPSERLTFPRGALGLHGGLKTMGGFAQYALERIGSSTLAERTAFLDQLALLRPDDAELSLARAKLAFKAGRHRAAGKYLVQAHALAQRGLLSDPEIRLELADAALDFGWPKQAVGFLAEAETLSPDSGTLSNMAFLYQKGGQYAAALRILKGLPSVSPAEPRVWLDRAQAAWSAGQSELTAILLDKAEAFRQLGPQEMLGMAILRKNLGDDARALDLLRRAAEAEPNDVSILIELADAAYKAGNERVLALDSLDQAQALTGDMEKLRRIAELYQEAKEHKKALALLNRLTQEHPLEAVLYLDRGICEYEMNVATEAVSSLETAIRLKPRLWAAYLSLGAIYDAQNRPAEAAAIYDRALAAKSAKDNDLMLGMIRKSRLESLKQSRTPHL